MFTFRFNQALRVHSASAFKDSEGNDAFCILFLENENQPEGLERPSNSKSQIKIWGKGILPEAMHNGCLVSIESCAGFDWKHNVRKNKMTGEVITDRNGQTIYDHVIELVSPVIKVLEPTETARKSRKKAEG